MGGRSLGASEALVGSAEWGCWLSCWRGRGLGRYDPNVGQFGWEVEELGQEVLTPDGEAFGPLLLHLLANEVVEHVVGLLQQWVSGSGFTGQ